MIFQTQPFLTKTLRRTLVNTVRQTLFRAGTIGAGSPTLGSRSKGKKLRSAPNTTRKSGNLDPRKQGGGGLLRGSISGHGRFWLNWPSRILAEGRPEWSDITWGLLEDGEFGQMSRVIRY